MVREVSNSKSLLNGDEGSVHPAGVTSSEARAMLSAAFNIFERWGMSNDQARTLLGGPSERTFQRWKSKDIASVPVDTIWRLGDILGIHKALRYMFTEPDRGYEWVKKPNKKFLGKSALDVMLMGSQAHLSAIRNYLDAERGGW